MDFAGKLQAALEAARPHREQHAAFTAEAKTLESEFSAKRKAKTTDPRECEERWKAKLREAREAEAKAAGIENAVYDFKAVNPHRVTVEDRRTPAELLGVIDAKGREAGAALARLRELIACPA